MKKLVIICASLLVFSGAYAQNHAHTKLPASERAAHQTEWMKNNLQLSGDQLSKVQDVNMRYATKMDDIRSSTQTKMEKKAAAKELSDQKDGELKGIFNENQYSAYRAKKMEIMEKVTK